MVLNSSIDELEFQVIVEYVARKIKRVKVNDIIEGEVYCTAYSNSGLSSWDFSVEFSGINGIGSTYSLYNNNYESNLPEFFATQISNLIESGLTSGESVNNSSEINYCPYCGSKVFSDNLYCGYCGRKTFKLEAELIKLQTEREKSKREQIQAEKEISKRDLEIEREQSIQAQLSSENLEKRRKFLLSTFKILGPIVAIIFAVFTVYNGINAHIEKTQLQTVNSEHIKNGDIQLVFSSSDFKNNETNKEEPIKYKSVKQDFKNAGFTNIQIDKQKDLNFFSNKDGNVISVSINGDNDFSEGEWFPKDSIVKITYHSKK